MRLAYIPSPARSSWHFGPLPVRAQALCVIAGILLAVWLAGRRYRAIGGRRGVVLDVAAWAVPAGLIGAAAGVVLVDGRRFFDGNPGLWHTVRVWDTAIGFPGAVALGAAGAWLGCRRIHGPRGERVRLGPVAGAAAPAIAFGAAVVSLGNWLAQRSYGEPSSLWWAVRISPEHRLPGYENYATFQPVFMYQALWDVATGITVIWAARRFSLPGPRVFALYAALFALGGFWLEWLRIGQATLVLGIRTTELGDAVVFALGVGYLIRTRRMRGVDLLPAPKSALERDSSSNVTSV
ncbi:MAG: prolipoprotein diacylglyceryl transferase [Streptosporangiaceae bacterium]|nr:prolipoprotein diacylglyceryl transferase [Streptosporangiaceae bacterium]